MTPEQSAKAIWYADEANLVNLKALLANEVFQQALNVVRTIYRPTRNSITLDNNTIAASVHHINAGANDALDALFALTAPQPTPQRVPQPKQLEPINLHP